MLKLKGGLYAAFLLFFYVMVPDPITFVMVPDPITRDPITRTGEQQ